MNTVKKLNKPNDSGFTIVELMVAVVMGGLILGGVLTTVVQSTHKHHDYKVHLRTEEKARILLDAIVYDIRMIGSGLPVGAANFEMDDVTLGTAPLPLLTTSSDTQINLRVSEKGLNTVTTANYTPSSTDLDITVMDPAEFIVGDTIYISDMPKGGDSGMQATVQSISGSILTIDSSYVATAGAIFNLGSYVFNVSDISYDSPADWSGITRNNGTGVQVLLPNTKFTLEYRDESGTVLSLPLTATQIANNLASIRVTVQVRSSAELHEGVGTYTAVAIQSVMLRNLNL